jgi:hypothetical protein
VVEIGKFLDMQLPSVPKLDESRFHFTGLDVVFEASAERGVENN